MRPIFERQRIRVVENLRKWAPPKIGALPEESIDDLLLDHREWNVVLSGMGRSLGEFVAAEAGNGLIADLAVAGVSFDVNVPEVQRLLDERYGNPAYEHTGTWPQWINEGTNGQLRDELRAGLREQLHISIDRAESVDLLEKRVEKVFGRRKGYQTRRIARTEVMGAHSHGADAAQKQIGAVGKEWLTSLGPDRRSWHEAMEGVIVPHDKPFLVPGAKGGSVYMMHPHAFGAPPEQVIQCECSHQPVMDEEEVREATAALAEEAHAEALEELAG